MAGFDTESVAQVANPFHGDRFLCQVTKANLDDVKRYRIGLNLHTWIETGERLFW